MMYRHALRAGEVIDLHWDQLDFKAGKFHVNRLKNGDPAVHPLDGDTIRSLRKLQRESPESPFVFASERGGPLTTRTVHHIVSRAGVAAGIKFPVHPHQLRHAKGYQLAAKGENTRAIQGYLGHKNIQHTVIYTKLDARRFEGFGLSTDITTKWRTKPDIPPPSFTLMKWAINSNGNHPFGKEVSLGLPRSKLRILSLWGEIYHELP